MNKNFLIFGLAFCVSTLAVVGPASAGSLSGSWSGSGTIQALTGESEKARCRVKYSKRGASSYAVTARCASTSGKVVQSATVRPTGKNKYSGSFYNKKYNARGSFSVSLRGNRQTIVMSSNQGSARLTLSKR